MSYGSDSETSGLSGQNNAMVPIPAEYMPDFWDELSENPMVELSCFLPNGIMVLLKVNHNATLGDIKEVNFIKTLFQFIRVTTLPTTC